MSDDDSEDSGDGEEYQWRETYFILFRASKRPTLTQVERTVGELNNRLRLENLTADDDGRFESVVIHSPDDYAAIELSYETGEAVTEQATDLAKQLKSEAEADELSKLLVADARLDVMHFEQMVSDSMDDDEEEMLDPSSLLMVVDALVGLTEGIAVDPASGAIMP